jgi:hypothetical protein
MAETMNDQNDANASVAKMIQVFGCFRRRRIQVFECSSFPSPANSGNKSYCHLYRHFIDDYFGKYKSMSELCQ